MQLFDTHAHLDDESFHGILDEVVDRATQAGVIHIIAVGTTADSSERCVELARRYDCVRAAVGIQPNYCHEAGPGDWDRVQELATDSHVVAIGETGLDRYWDHCPFELQTEYFVRHVRLSQESGLPFIVHMRDCESDIIETLTPLAEQAALHGVMHSYTGSIDGARTFIRLGLWISFAGMVTYKKSDDLREVAKSIPNDRILIETDAPYLSPHPKRGHRPNEPGMVVHTARCLAEARNQPETEFGQLITQNAMNLFGMNPQAD